MLSSCWGFSWGLWLKLTKTFIIGLVFLLAKLWHLSFIIYHGIQSYYLSYWERLSLHSFASCKSCCRILHVRENLNLSIKALKLNLNLIGDLLTNIHRYAEWTARSCIIISLDVYSWDPNKLIRIHHFSFLFYCVY